MSMKHFTSAMNDSTTKTAATTLGALAFVAAKTILEMEIRKHYSKKNSAAEKAKDTDVVVEDMDVRVDPPKDEQTIVDETEQN